MGHALSLYFLRSVFLFLVLGCGELFQVELFPVVERQFAAAGQAVGSQDIEDDLIASLARGVAVVVLFRDMDDKFGADFADGKRLDLVYNLNGTSTIAMRQP